AGYGRLGEVSGTAASDASANGNAGRYWYASLGRPGALSGDADPAAGFNGSSSVVSVGDRFDFAGTASFSLEAWVRPNTLDSLARRVFSKRVTDAGGVQGYEL